MRKCTTGNRPRSMAVMVAASLAVAACGGEVESAPEGAPGDQTATTITTSTSAADDPSADQGEAATTDGDLAVVHLPLMGGLSLLVEPDQFVYTAGELAILGPDAPFDETTDPQVFIALVAQDITGRPVADASGLAAVLAAVPGATVEETGASIEALGLQLTGLRVDRDPTFEPAQVFISSPPGFAPSGAAWQPFPVAELFVSPPTPNGVVVLGAGAPDQERLVEAKAMLERVAPTLSFTGPGLDTELAYGGGPVLAGQPSPPPEPVSPSPELSTLRPFSPAPPDEYQLDQLGAPLAVTVAEEGWMTLPNFPGIVGLTNSAGSIGPNHDDLVFAVDVVEIVPTTPGPGRAGESIPLGGEGDLAAFLAAPPAGLGVGSVEDFSAPGISGTVFDVAIDPEVTCTIDQPCSYTFVTAYGLTKEIVPATAYRIWLLDTPTRPLAVFAASHDDTWLDTASIIVASLRSLDS